MTDDKWTDKSQPFDTQIFVTIITVYIVPWSRTTMARATNNSISEEKGFAKCVSTLFYITKFSGIVPFDLFIYKRSKAFVLSTIGTWLSIGCATFYLSYYNYLLARMYFTLPISAIGKSIHHILLPTSYIATYSNCVATENQQNSPNSRFVDIYHRHLYHVFGDEFNSGRHRVHGLLSKIIYVVHRTHRTSWQSIAPMSNYHRQ